MSEIENNSNIEIIDNESNNVTEKLNTKEKDSALSLLKTIEAKINNYDIDLAFDIKQNKYYLIGNKETYLNIPLDLNDLAEYGDNIIKLLNYEGEIQLIGGKEWRAIAEKSFISLGGNANENRLIYKGLENGKETEFYTNENNKTEELFKFVQTLKKIPKEKWIISDSIKKTGEIGIQKPTKPQQ